MNHTGGMVKTAHPPCLIVLLLAVTAPWIAVAEPRLLADAEMDGITAAGVRVEVEAYARALGDIALTRTNARALTRIVRDRVKVGVGLAEGQALACCGEGASVAVGSSAAGGGDVAYGDTVSHVFHGVSLSDDHTLEQFAFGYSASLLLEASSNGGADAGALGKLGHNLIGDGVVPSADGLTTGFAFAPVYTAGLRWRAARYLTGEPHDLPHVATASQLASRRLTQARQAISLR
jgi:hypothetical protein